MAEYVVSGPNGAVYHVTAPDGASPDEVKARVQREHQAAPPAPSTPTPGVIAAATGLSNGVTAGLSDRIAAGMGAVVPNPAHTSIWQGPQGMRSLGDAYDLTRQQIQGYAGDLKSDHPRLDLAGEMAGSVLSPLAKMLPGGGTARALLNDGLYGGIYGAATDKKPAEGAAEGAASGIAGGALTRGLARAASPVLSPAVQKLKELGVTLTPGQALGGIAKSMEDKLTSIPGLGDLINNSRRAGVAEFNRGVINKALVPIGAIIPRGIDAGQDAIDWAHRAVSGAYQKALSNMHVQPDAVFATGMRDVLAGVGNLAEDQAKDFHRVIEKHVTPFVGDVMDGSAVQDVKQGLSAAIARYRNGAPRDHDVADALQGVKDEFLGLAQRASGEAADLYRAADKAFANLVPVSAARAKVPENAPFSPSNLATAVRQADRTARKTAFARGNARMQDASDAGMAVLPSKVPNSGTMDRLLAAGTVGGGVGAAALGHPVALGAGTFASWPYIPGGRQAADWLFTGRQGPVAKQASDVIRRLAGPAAAIAPLFLAK